MGLFSSTVCLAVGIATGMYLAQNYTVPDMNALLKSSKKSFAAWERTSRKAGEDEERERRRRDDDERSWRRDR